MLRHAARPAADLETLTVRAWRFALDHHIHERFSEEYRKAAEAALACHVPARIIGSRSPDVRQPVRG